MVRHATRIPRAIPCDLDSACDHKLGRGVMCDHESPPPNESRTRESSGFRVKRKDKSFLLTCLWVDNTRFGMLKWGESPFARGDSPESALDHPERPTLPWELFTPLGEMSIHPVEIRG